MPRIRFFFRSFATPAILAPIALLFGACTEAPGTQPTFDAAAQVALVGFQNRYLALYADRDAMSDADFDEAYRTLGEDLELWNERTGLIEPTVRQTKDCPDLEAASIDTEPFPRPGGMTCKPCPSRPHNTPSGMICILVKDDCDRRTGTRSCTYHCYPIFRGWYA